MPERRLPQDPAAAARLAAHEEKIATLQRERREDREDARKALDQIQRELRADIEELKTAMTDGLNAVRAELVPIKGEIAPITDLRKRGTAFLVGASLAGMAFGYKFLEPLIKWLGIR